MKKELFKRILFYGVPIAVIFYISIPRGIPHTESYESSRQRFLKRIEVTTISLFVDYIEYNKKLPKNTSEVFNYARKIKKEYDILSFIGKDSNVRENFSRDNLKLIKLYELPDINIVKTFKIVKEDANIAYYFSQNGNNVMINFYIIDGEGKFLVDSKNRLIPRQREVEITN